MSRHSHILCFAIPRHTRPGTKRDLRLSANLGRSVEGEMVTISRGIAMGWALISEKCGHKHPRLDINHCKTMICDSAGSFFHFHNHNSSSPTCTSVPPSGITAYGPEIAFFWDLPKGPICGSALSKAHCGHSRRIDHTQAPKSIMDCRRFRAVGHSVAVPPKAVC